MIQVYDANKNLIHSFTAHTNIIEHIKILSNGNVASCSDDSTIKIWDTSSWSLIKTLSGHIKPVLQIEQIDNDTIVSASFDKTYIVWSISMGAKITMNIFSVSVEAVKFIPSSGLLAVGLASTSKNLQIYNWKTGDLVTTLNGHTNTVFGIEILDSRYIATASADKTAMVWDLTGLGSLKYTLKGHYAEVISLKLISSSLLASGSNDYTIKIWKWNKGSVIKSLTGHANVIWPLINT